MTRAYRFLTTSVNSSSMAMAESPEKAPVESEFRLILAASLCALVCFVGYLALVTCTWLKRRSMTNQSQVKPPANKGLEREYVEALPKFAYDLSKEYNERKLSSSECVICLVEYANGDEIRVLPQCGHEFHIGCIDKWFSSHSSCPSCRQTVVIGKCKMCGEFPTITTGNNLLVAEHESRQPNDGSCSVIRVDGSL